MIRLVRSVMMSERRREWYYPKDPTLPRVALIEYPPPQSKPAPAPLPPPTPTSADVLQPGLFA